MVIWPLSDFSGSDGGRVRTGVLVFVPSPIVRPNPDDSGELNWGSKGSVTCSRMYLSLQRLESSMSSK